jgi:catechol 2,3-dioxygenase-like lactoylglutathione lyase family enzyme
MRYKEMMPGLPFGNISHLGWAVRDIDKTIKTFEDLGLGPWRRYVLGEPGTGHDFEKREYEGGMEQRAKVALARWGAIVIELFEPIYMPVVAKFLETKGEGIWHFGYSVSREQFDATIAEVKNKGIEVFGTAQYKNGVRMAFLDPNKTGGIIFQLHDSPPEMEAFLDTMGMMV